MANQVTIEVTEYRPEASGYHYEAAVISQTGQLIWAFHSDIKRWAQVQALQYWPGAQVVDKTAEVK